MDKVLMGTFLSSPQGDIFMESRQLEAAQLVVNTEVG